MRAAIAALLIAISTAASAASTSIATVGAWRAASGHERSAAAQDMTQQMGSRVSASDLAACISGVANSHAAPNAMDLNDLAASCATLIHRHR